MEISLWMGNQGAGLRQLPSERSPSSGTGQWVCEMGIDMASLTLSLTHSLVLSFSSLPLSISPALSFPLILHLCPSLSSACVLSLSLSPSFSLSTHPRLIEDWTQLKWLKQKSQTPFSCGGGGPADIGHVLMYWQGRVIWTESRPNQIRRPDPYRSVSLCRMLIISDWEERGKPEEPAGTSSHLRQWINWQAIEYLSAADVMWNGKAADV